MPAGLTGRVLGACALVTAVVGVVFVLQVQSLAAQRTAVTLSLHSRNVLASADEAERLVIDLETGVRGYLLTGEESFLEPWTTARKALGPQLADLRQLARVPEQHARAVAVTEAVDSYIDEFSVPLVDAARRGDPSARSVTTTTEGRVRIDEIRALFSQLRTTENGLLARRDRDSLARARQTAIVVSAGLGISLAVMLVMAGYWARSILRPVLRAARTANRLADGDLAARVPETGAGEIRTLERSFNRMASSITELVAEQTALRSVATLVARGEAPDAVFAVVVEQAVTVLDVDAAALVRLEADGTIVVVADGGMADVQTQVGTKLAVTGSSATAEALRTGSIAGQETYSGPEGSIGAVARERGISLSVAAPIAVGGRVWGVLVVASMRPRQRGEIDARLAQFTELVATAVANSQAQEDLAASRARLVAAGDETRRRIERDLHDGVQQRLVSLALTLRLVEADAAGDPPGLRAELTEVASELDAAITELRELSRGIHPASLSQGGLDAAVRVLARRCPLTVDLDLRIDPRPSPSVETAAYYVVAEALTNATKHAAASTVRIEAAVRDGRLELVIADDGVGGADPGGGSGLVGLRDRVEALGGRLAVVSPPGHGTRLRVELPLTAVQP